MSATQFLTYNLSTGNVTGIGFSPDGAVPNTITTGNTTVSTLIVANTTGWQFGNISNGVFIPGATPTPSLAKQATAAMANGLTITSNSTSTLDGVYDVSATAQSHIQAEVVSILLSGGTTFIDGSNTVIWPDMSGVNHTFNVSQFQSFGSAVGLYVSSLYRVINGTLSTLPPNSVTIL